MWEGAGVAMGSASYLYIFFRTVLVGQLCFCCKEEKGSIVLSNWPCIFTKAVTIKVNETDRMAIFDPGLVLVAITTFIQDAYMPVPL